MRRAKERTNVRASVDSAVRRGTSSSLVSASSNLGMRGSLRGAGSAGVSVALEALLFTFTRPPAFLREALVFGLSSLSWKGRYATSAYAGGKGLPSIRDTSSALPGKPGRV